MKYSENVDSLIALISHLGLTQKKSRTAPFIAKAINLPTETVRRILLGYPGIFRQSTNVSSAGESFYTLQIRYALRGSQYGDSTGEEDGTPLEVGDIKWLVDFVTAQSHQEQDVSLATAQLSQTQASLEQQMTIANREIAQHGRATLAALGASIIAAIAAVVAATIAASK